METNIQTNQFNAATKFKGQVLGQVYRVWLFRKLLPVLIFEVFTLAVVLYQLGQAVFIQKILENALGIIFAEPTQIVSFVVSMFTQASLMIKILGFAVLILSAMLLRHVTQGMLRFFLVRQNYFSRIKK